MLTYTLVGLSTVFRNSAASSRLVTIPGIFIGVLSALGKAPPPAKSDLLGWPVISFIPVSLAVIAPITKDLEIFCIKPQMPVLAQRLDMIYVHDGLFCGASSASQTLEAVLLQDSVTQLPPLIRAVKAVNSVLGGLLRRDWLRRFLRSPLEYKYKIWLERFDMEHQSTIGFVDAPRGIQIHEAVVEIEVFPGGSYDFYVVCWVFNKDRFCTQELVYFVTRATIHSVKFIVFLVLFLAHFRSIENLGFIDFIPIIHIQYIFVPLSWDLLNTDLPLA